MMLTWAYRMPVLVGFSLIFCRLGFNHHRKRRGKGRELLIFRFGAIFDVFAAFLASLELDRMLGFCLNFGNGLGSLFQRPLGFRLAFLKFGLGLRARRCGLFFLCVRAVSALARSTAAGLMR